MASRNSALILEQFSARLALRIDAWDFGPADPSALVLRNHRCVPLRFHIRALRWHVTKRRAGLALVHVEFTNTFFSVTWKRQMKCVGIAKHYNPQGLVSHRSPILGTRYRIIVGLGCLITSP